MEERDTGVVLRTRPLTETSLIVHWLTERAGRIATVARGARRPKSAFRGKLDLCQVARITFQRSRRGDLHTLREAVSVRSFPELRTSIEGLQSAAHAARLLERVVETDAPVGSLYALFLQLVEEAASHPEDPLPLLWFEWHLLADQGLAPSPEQAGLSPGGQAILLRLQAAATNPPRIRLSTTQQQELRACLNHWWEQSGVRPPRCGTEGSKH